ncbi:hypothetical protein SODALDRAFT_267604 [Sodiomyces alkalinus F11]|uniref:Uncharacterized protein n=1 Tax=Sodiomyces alkalinus (strain CBS 110278 / VKM F-3762 / F11) TaxID=1314773 RepID=A0A3N2Q8U6_SODAK|nr:hypothetical protein SODALDRAFT_267604 [Sodiomyces alkalinus F11]ROT43160.1 hypothetical protein SODALDRAFT_267604 [Sodiomyces alkalinus F11]
MHSDIDRLSTPSPDWRESLRLKGMARRTLGISCLLLTVFLWTLSNFMGSYIFSDSTYDKPFFVVYVNTSIFAIALIPVPVRFLLRHGVSGARRVLSQAWREQPSLGRQTTTHTRGGEDVAAVQRLLVDDEVGVEGLGGGTEATATETYGREQGGRLGGGKLSLRETATLSLEFCLLWFTANYLSAACLQFTSVASVTILTSTSSVWTLLLGTAMGIEKFTRRKLFGVLASLAGVALISSLDLSGSRDEDRGSFPHKTPGELALGDAMALLSAVIYGVYITLMKRKVGSEERMDMQLFFGLVGTFNLLLLWPLFFIFHWTGFERFQLPPTGTIWGIIMVNAMASFISDIAWAYAMLLTTPLLVTVGLSLTIPLSLVGEMIQYGQYSTLLYWIGAAVVVVSFLFINHESQENGAELLEIGRRIGSEGR